MSKGYAVSREHAPGRSRRRFAVWRGRRIYPELYYSDEELRELEAMVRQRRRRRLVQATLVVAPLVVAIGIVGFFVREGGLSGDHSGTTDVGTTAPALTGGAPPDTQVVNEGGGYAFRHPVHWDISQLGTRTVATDPSGDVNLWVDVTADGEIDKVLTTVLPTLTSNWSLVTTEGPIVRHVGGRPAISVGGTGVADGQMVRFLAIVVDGGDRNDLIFVSVPRERDPVTVTPQIERILASFEPLTGG